MFIIAQTSTAFPDNFNTEIYEIAVESPPVYSSFPGVEL